MSRRMPWIAIMLAIYWLAPGCGPASNSSPQETAGTDQRPGGSSAPGLPRKSPEPVSPSRPAAHEEAGHVPPVVEESPGERNPLPVQIAGPDHDGSPTVDLERVKAAGLRVLEGEQITIYTDIPADPAIDELPRVFDLAIAQWGEYFGVEKEKTVDWKVVGSVIKDKQRFIQAGLLPESLPPFSHGYSAEYRVWLLDQPSDYYRRHLLLHEGTHAFMVHFLQGGGPPWYMEGMAELLGTHRWDGNTLALRHFPQAKSETPYWGRIKIVKDDLAAGRGMPLRAIMGYPADAHLKIQPYGWCWAASSFFDFHPEYQPAFRKMIRHSRDSSGGFSEHFLRSLQDEWPRIQQEWQLFLFNIQYGYDIPREAIEDRPIVMFPEGGGTHVLQADRGWQSTGFQIPAGSRLQLAASGQFQLGTDPVPWISEAEGVTVVYHRGQPLGRLLAAVAQPGEQGQTRLARPHAVGASGTLDCPEGGILYLRVNDAPSQLADNKGQLSVRITLVAP